MLPVTQFAEPLDGGPAPTGVGLFAVGLLARRGESRCSVPNVHMPGNRVAGWRFERVWFDELVAMAEARGETMVGFAHRALRRELERCREEQAGKSPK